MEALLSFILWRLQDVAAGSSPPGESDAVAGVVAFVCYISLLRCLSHGCWVVAHRYHHRVCFVLT